VEGLLLAEHVVNMSKRRLKQSSGDYNKREDCVWRTPKEYDQYLKKDLTQGIGSFWALFYAKAEDPDWKRVLTFLPYGSENLPFLKDDALQALRKGTFAQEFSFVSEKEREVLRQFVEVVNTIDVLKPFLHENSADFYQRAERIAGVLKEESLGFDDKKTYFLKLMEEASTSIKDEILGTRLGLMARVRQVLSSGEASPTLLTGDVVGFGPINLAALYVDALNYLNTQDGSFDPKALKALLLSAGDKATEFLRYGDTVVRQNYGTFGKLPYMDASGGDEMRVLVDGTATERPLVLNHKKLLFERPVRLTTTDLSGLNNGAFESIPELFAAVALVSEKVFETLKKRGEFGPVALVVGK